MKKFFMTFIIGILTISIFVSCSGDKKSSDVVKKDETSKPVATESPKTYSIKSGIIFYDADALGIPTKQEYYFDDFGAKECRITKVELEMLGSKTSSISYEILKDGWLYKFDNQKKECTQTKAFQPIGKVSGMPDLAALSADMMKQYKYKELESKDFFGHACKGVSMNVMGMKIEAWSYNNLLMFSKIWMGEQKTPMEMKATKFEENAKINSTIFEVPSDYKITKL